jgi:PAS domain S-box-containing protein
LAAAFSVLGDVLFMFGVPFMPVRYTLILLTVTIILVAGVVLIRRHHPDRGPMAVILIVGSVALLQVAVELDSIRGALQSWLDFTPMEYQRLVGDPLNALLLCGLSLGLLLLSIDWSENAAIRQEKTRALQESEAQFRSVIETAGSLIVCTGTDGRVFEWNREAERVFGVSREEAIGQEFASLYKPPISKERIQELWKRVAAEEFSDYESVIEGQDGVDRVILWRASPLKDGEGKFLGAVGAGQDITEYKELRDQVQHRQKLESLGVLAGGIAHDFNNLLVGILGNADLAKAEMPGDSAAQHSVDLIRKAAGHAAQLTHQMLTYAGRGQPSAGPLELSSLVREMQDLLLASSSKKVTVSARLAENLPAIEGDKGQIQQVMMNLITNASEAIGDADGVITLETGVLGTREGFLPEWPATEFPEAEAYVYLRVADTGCGMSEETRGKMFDPFYTTKFAGRGLGLASVLGIIRGHGGHIHVESEEGRGTEIHVLFPRSSAVAGEAPVAAGERRLAPARGTILVVDDEHAVQDMAQRSLENAGFQVMCASDGCEAMDLFRQHRERIDAVLLDMTMPKMGGKETLLGLRGIRPDLRVVLTSGYDKENAAEPFDHGEGKPIFLQKPFGAKGLVDAMRESMGRDGREDQDKNGSLDVKRLSDEGVAGDGGDSSPVGVHFSERDGGVD